MAAAAQGGVHARSPVGLPRPLMDRADLGEQFGVLAATGAGVTTLFEPAIVGRGRNLEVPQDRIDTKILTAGFNERYDRLLVGSISWAKKALAALRISLARLSSGGVKLRWPRADGLIWPRSYRERCALSMAMAASWLGS